MAITSAYPLKMVITKWTTVLLGTREVANDYRLSGYPTMFLIDKNGKIIFIQDGYDKEVERTLEEVILKNLSDKASVILSKPPVAWP
jgi:thioredoxin-related protein